MKIFTQFALVLTVAAATVSAQGAPAVLPQGQRLLPVYRAQNHSNVFTDARQNTIDALNKRMFGEKAPQRASQYKPGYTLGPAQSIGDIDVAGGGMWFYTMDVDYTEVVHNPYWTERFRTAFTIRIYDGENKLIGTIRDKITLEDDEVRNELCEVTPFVTRHFFNTDDKIEIAVGQGFNTPRYVNTYRTKVYQLDGEKDAEGNDKPVSVIPDHIGDILDATGEDGVENIYVAMFKEGADPVDNENPEEGSDAYWENMLRNYYNVEIQAKATDATGPRTIFTKKINTQCTPGDQGDTSPRMISMKDASGKPMFVIPQYKEPFFNPIKSSSDNPSQRAGNKLQVEFYTVDNDKVSLLNSTEIPAEPTEGDGILCTYYGIGDFNYRRDVSFEHWGGTAAKPAFVVTRKVLTTSESGAGVTYTAYDGNGNKALTLFEGSEAAVTMSDIPGHEPQVMFVNTPGGEYTFHFVDLYSGTERATVKYQIEVEDSDPEMMTSNLDRVAVGDTYMYVDEMRLPVEDNDNTFMRLAWLDAKGKWVRTDEVNMGRDIKYAKALVNGTMLSDPNTFFIDKEGLPEYMVLIKRGLATGGDREELLIGQARSESYPDGRTVMLLDEDPRGVLQSIAPYSFMGVPTLMVSYYDQPSGTIAADYYSLPFNPEEAGVNDVITDSMDSGIAFDGSIVTAEGTVTVYNAAGMSVARGEGSLSVKGLQPGLYIVTAGNGARKIVVK